jgi:hypothetical protein
LADLSPNRRRIGTVGDHALHFACLRSGLVNYRIDLAVARCINGSPFRPTAQAILRERSVVLFSRIIHINILQPHWIRPIRRIIVPISVGIHIRVGGVLAEKGAGGGVVPAGAVLVEAGGGVPFAAGVGEEVGKVAGVGN